MSSHISLAATKVNVKQEQLEKDGDGYYLVTLGAFNTFNTSGVFYLEDKIRDFIHNDNYYLSKRIKQGYLYGEMGHPQRLPGQSPTDFLLRTGRIDMDRISHHIKEVLFVPTNKSSGVPGQPNILLCKGWVKPAGVFGDKLQASLDNPNINTAFSLRAIHDESKKGGIPMKTITQIITWDWVLQPGMSCANKWDTLTADEDVLIPMLTKDMLDTILNDTEIITVDNDTYSVLAEARDLTFSNRVDSVGHKHLLSRW